MIASAFDYFWGQTKEPVYAVVEWKVADALDGPHDQRRASHDAQTVLRPLQRLVHDGIVKYWTKERI